jgi:hypothetical protein
VDERHDWGPEVRAAFADAWHEYDWKSQLALRMLEMHIEGLRAEEPRAAAARARAPLPGPARCRRPWLWWILVAAAAFVILHCIAGAGGQ